jgi:hypothetical protein
MHDHWLIAHSPSFVGAESPRLRSAVSQGGRTNGATTTVVRNGRLIFLLFSYRRFGVRYGYQMERGAVDSHWQVATRVE